MGILGNGGNRRVEETVFDSALVGEPFSPAAPCPEWGTGSTFCRDRLAMAPLTQASFAQVRWGTDSINCAWNCPTSVGEWQANATIRCPPHRGGCPVEKPRIISSVSYIGPCVIGSGHPHPPIEPQGRLHVGSDEPIESNLAAILTTSVCRCCPTLPGKWLSYTLRGYQSSYDLEVGHVNTNTIWWIAGVLLVIVLVIVIIRMI